MPYLFRRPSRGAAMAFVLTALALARPTSAVELRQPAGDAFVFTVPLSRAYAPCTTPNTVSWTGVPACAPPVSSPCLWTEANLFQHPDGYLLLNFSRLLPIGHGGSLGDPDYCRTGTYEVRVTSRTTSDGDEDNVFCNGPSCTFPDRVTVTSFVPPTSRNRTNIPVETSSALAVNGNVEILNVTIIAPDGLPLLSMGTDNVTSDLGVAYPPCTSPDPNHSACTATPWRPACDFNSGMIEPGINVRFTDVKGVTPACMTGTYQLTTGIRTTLSDCNATAGSQPCTLLDQTVTLPMTASGDTLTAPPGLGLNGSATVVAAEVTGLRILDPTGALLATTAVPGMRALTAPRITLHKDKLSLRALFPPEILFGGIDLGEIDGMVLELTSRDGVLFSVHIPAVRWQLQPPLGERWTYVDQGGVLAGTRKASVRLKRKKGLPIGYDMRLEARGLPPPTGDGIGVNLTITVPRITGGMGDTVSAQRNRTCRLRNLKLRCQ